MAKTEVKSPAFQFYPNDFLSDANTIVMTAEEIGIYWLLICVCWKEGGLPNNFKKLSKIARVGEKKFKKLWDASLKICFYLNENGDRYGHARLDAERAKRSEFTASQSENGKKGAEKRWGSKDGDAIISPMAKNSSSSSSSSSKESTNVDSNATAVAIEPPDPVETRIWKDGVTMLERSSVKSSAARSLLGKLAKDHTKIVLAECIAATQAANPADPRTYLIAALRNRKSGSASMLVGRPRDDIPVELDWKPRECDGCNGSGYIDRYPDEPHVFHPDRMAVCDKCDIAKEAASEMF